MTLILLFINSLTKFNVLFSSFGFGPYTCSAAAISTVKQDSERRPVQQETMAVGKENVEVVEITKPRTDTRDYKRIVLPNSLQVLLISDPDTDKVYR